jgi:hypothetical protein
MARKKSIGFRVRFPHFGLFLVIAVTLAIPLTVWSLNNVSTITRQEAATVTCPATAIYPAWSCGSICTGSVECDVSAAGTQTPAGCKNSGTWFAQGRCGTNGGCHYAPQYQSASCGYVAPPTTTPMPTIPPTTPTPSPVTSCVSAGYSCLPTCAPDRTSVNLTCNPGYYCCGSSPSAPSPAPVGNCGTWSCPSSRCIASGIECDVSASGVQTPAGCLNGTWLAVLRACGTAGVTSGTGGCHYTPQYQSATCGYVAPTSTPIVKVTQAPTNLSSSSTQCYPNSTLPIFRFSWNAVPNASGYDFFYYINYKNGVRGGIIGPLSTVTMASKTTYVLYDLPNNIKSISWYVRGRNLESNGPTSRLSVVNNPCR